MNKKKIKKIVKCLVFIPVICILFSFSAFSLTITTESGARFDIKNGSFYSPSLSAGTMNVNPFVNELGDTGVAFYINNGSLRNDIEFRIPVEVIDGQGFNGHLSFSISSNGGVPYWVNQQNSFSNYFKITDVNNNIIAPLSRIDDDVLGLYNWFFDGDVSLPNVFYIHGIINATEDMTSIIAVNFDFNRFYPSADGSDINDLHNMEDTIIQSQQGGLNEYFNMVNGLSGMPTTNMNNGLLVVSRMFTQFFDFDNNIRSIFTISLSLGLFAFVVGMTVLLVRGRNK